MAPKLSEFHNCCLNAGREKKKRERVNGVKLSTWIQEKMIKEGEEKEMKRKTKGVINKCNLLKVEHISVLYSLFLSP